MLPYFKIPKITRAQERRKEQELRAIIKTLARNKMKSAGKVFAPFNTIIVKREPPAHLLTAKDWFSDLMGCLLLESIYSHDTTYDDLKAYIMADPYFEGDSAYDGYFSSAFDIDVESNIDEHGWKNAWPKKHVKDWAGLTTEEVSKLHFGIANELKNFNFSKGVLSNGAEVWICEITRNGQSYSYVLNKKINGKFLLPSFHDKDEDDDVFFIHKKKDIRYISDQEEKTIKVRRSIIFVDDQFSDNNHLWEIQETQGLTVVALILDPSSQKEYFLNQIGSDFLEALKSSAWEDGYFQQATLSKIFTIEEEMELREKLKPSTIAMLYKLQKNGYVQLVNGDPNASVL